VGEHRAGGAWRCAAEASADMPTVREEKSAAPAAARATASTEVSPAKPPSAPAPATATAITAELKRALRSRRRRNRLDKSAAAAAALAASGGGRISAATRAGTAASVIFCAGPTRTGLRSARTMSTPRAPARLISGRLGRWGDTAQATPRQTAARAGVASMSSRSCGVRSPRERAFTSRNLSNRWPGSFAGLSRHPIRRRRRSRSRSGRSSS